ncbi:MAG: ribonuclease HII [Streptosporangiales bacterium]|nr:ribonuclease HII [Streptosporangiales bacterium]
MTGQNGDEDRPARPVPTYAIEERLTAAGAAVVAGVDEVGRGAWAGPVMVCAAVTGGGPPPAGLTDSKLLTAKRRDALEAELAGWVTGHAIGAASPEEIDELGMTEALRRAACRALEALPVRPDAVILDGAHDYLGAPWAVRCQVKADLTCVSVAAASVLAKVRRDALMAELDPAFPGYDFAVNAGYPSPAHQAALAAHGPTPHHRLSWSYLDDLPAWRHLKKHRDPLAGEGQLSLL